MSEELRSLSITEALALQKSGEVSAVELTRAYLDQIERYSDLNAFITVTSEGALEQAAEADARTKAGEVPKLNGIPLAIKDLFCTKNLRTTAGSRILHNFVPPYESTVTQNLKNAGIVSLGKTNLDEFAMGSANMTSHFGPVINPWSEPDAGRKLVPGGSSGGSATAVAAKACLAATGTDTGGSIRQPASFCGIVGLKPSYGRCSRFGVVAFASSLDQAGPMARNVKDSALLFEAMAGYDDKDSTSANLPVPEIASSIDEFPAGLRVGIPREYRVDGMPQEIEALWNQGIAWLKSAGAEIIDISLPHTKYALPTYYIIGPAEASSNLARYDGMRFGLRVDGDDLTDTYMKTRAAGFGDEVKRRVFIGSYVLSSGYFDAYYLKAQKVRRKIIEDFDQAFEQIDVVLTPTAPSDAFEIGDKMDDPVAMYLNDVFTVPASLAGLPAISVPAGLSATGLPLGLQVIGGAWDEERVLKTGQAIESAAAFDHLPTVLRG